MARSSLLTQHGKWLALFSLATTLLSATFSATANARTEIEIAVGQADVAIPVSQYQGDDPTLPLFLWLPGHRGIAPPQHSTAHTLADLGFEVWIADLHTGYFVDTGRKSLDAFIDTDIAELIDAAHQRSGRDVIVMTRGRAARTALTGIRAYQQRIAGKQQASALIGSVLFSPQLTIPPQTPGDKAEYQAIARATNTAIYQIQPQITTTQWRTDEVAEALQSGGAKVFLHPLPNIQGGYHLRPDEDMTDADLDARAELPFLLERAAKVLSLNPRPTAAAALVEPKSTLAASGNRYGLKPLPPKPVTLSLPDLNGKPHSLAQHRGKLALVSFWASWCEPCLRELPSLKRLHDDLKDKGLDIVTVNASETPEVVRETVEQFAMHGYTLLMDHDGMEVKNWNVYGFPTNFLVNQKGELVYGSFGAIEWDEPEVRAVVESLL